MDPQPSIENILLSTKLNWPQAYQGISPIILRTIRSNQQFSSILETVISRYHIQSADFAVLVTLRRHPAPHCLSPTVLYGSMLLSSGGLTKILKRLNLSGLIERIDNPDDKRSKLVQLSDDGKALIEKAVKELHLQERQQLARLNTEEQQQLNKLLTKLVGS